MNNSWKKHITPIIIVTIIIALAGFIAQTFTDNIRSNRTAIIREEAQRIRGDEKLDAKKVDNQTMQLMIEAQQMQIDQNEKEFDRVYKEIKDNQNK